MKYRVEVNGSVFDIVVTGESVSIDGIPVDAELVRTQGDNIAMLRIGRSCYQIAASRVPGSEKGRSTLLLRGERFDATALDERALMLRQLARSAPRQAGPVSLVAPMPGLVVTINVAVGDVVVAGQGLLIMEAMKMENELRAASPGTVRVIHAAAGRPVERGEVLIELE